ncbi:hypothetical protein GGD81_002717 [Rhodobium orientis]|nr:hypothetical protein [Rhodobium orientis]
MAAGRPGHAARFDQTCLTCDTGIAKPAETGNLGPAMKVLIAVALPEK